MVYLINMKLKIKKAASFLAALVSTTVVLISNLVFD